ASTKAFTTQLVVLTLLGLHLADVRRTLDPERRRALIAGLRELPSRLESLRAIEPRMQELARETTSAQSALYLGRGPLYPIARERGCDVDRPRNLAKSVTVE